MPNKSIRRKKLVHMQGSEGEISSEGRASPGIVCEISEDEAQRSGDEVPAHMCPSLKVDKRKSETSEDLIVESHMRVIPCVVCVRRCVATRLRFEAFTEKESSVSPIPIVRPSCVYDIVLQSGCGLKPACMTGLAGLE